MYSKILSARCHFIQCSEYPFLLLVFRVFLLTLLDYKGSFIDFHMQCVYINIKQDQIHFTKSCNLYLTTHVLLSFLLYPSALYCNSKYKIPCSRVLTILKLFYPSWFCSSVLEARSNLNTEQILEAFVYPFVEGKSQVIPFWAEVPPYQLSHGLLKAAFHLYNVVPL